MTTATVETYNSELAAEVRAMAARRMIKNAVIARKMGMSEIGVSRRMRGETPWTIRELVQVASLLDCTVDQLLPHLDSNQESCDYWSVFGAA